MGESELNGVTIEFESLALQGAEKTKPLDVLYPPSVTKKMLANAQIALDYLEKEFPKNQAGLSLHTGAVIDLKTISQTDIPITSIDAPEAPSIKEALGKFSLMQSKPSEILKRIGYAINCNPALTKDSAERKRIEKIQKFNSLKTQEFQERPFVRIGCTDLKEIDRFIKDIPNNWTIAVEYSSEGGISIDTFVKYISEKNKINPNIGISFDFTHYFEYSFFNAKEGDKSKKIKNFRDSTMNLFQNILNDRPQLIMSVDINNIPINITRLGESHQHIARSEGIFDNRKIMEIYKDFLRTNNLKGRVDLEPSPLNQKIFLSPEGLAYISHQLEPIKN